MKQLIVVLVAFLSLGAAAKDKPLPIPTTPLYCITVEANGRAVHTLALDGTRSPESVQANVNNAVALAWPKLFSYSPAAPIFPPICGKDGCDQGCTMYTECGGASLKGGVLTCVSGGGCTCIKIHIVCGM